MSLTRFIKDALRKPESIPTPGAIFYNATVAKVLRKPETKIANDIVEKMGNGTILDLGSGTGYLSIEIATLEKESICDGVHVMAIGKEEVVPDILKAAGLAT